MMSDLSLSPKQVSIATRSGPLPNAFSTLQLILGVAISAAAIASYEVMPQLAIMVLMIGTGLLFSAIKNLNTKSFTE
jgi:hypothetical protein